MKTSNIILRVYLSMCIFIFLGLSTLRANDISPSFIDYYKVLSIPSLYTDYLLVVSTLTFITFIACLGFYVLTLKYKS